MAHFNFLSLFDLQFALGTDFGCFFYELGLARPDYIGFLVDGGLAELAL